MDEQLLQRTAGDTGTRRKFEPRPLVGFKRATRAEPCPICKATKYCQVTRDDKLAHCMRKSAGSKKQARDGGWIHVLIAEDYEGRKTVSSIQSAPQATENSERTLLAPIEVRNAAYIKL
ncbi:MAG: hypothetical protein MSG64_14620 [Pyrinomonadaceae bacterium MAG19_C2-C3]|nr:hypothetical protein [Pyrinomonadaceae bacterium MAG19_C2-C3]